MPHSPIGLPPGIAYEAAGQDEAKYTTRNPVVRKLIDRLMRRLRQQVTERTSAVLDVGVGEGWAAAEVFGPGMTVIGVEYRQDKVSAARGRVAGLRPVVADAGMLPLPDDAVGASTCLEVLEHLVDPAAAVHELGRVTRDRCVVSVPWEPWFRIGNLARGKNVSRLGNDVEHINAFGRASLERLLGEAFEEVVVRECFPWLVGVARRPRRTGAEAA